jgi:hypothetical protein
MPRRTHPRRPSPGAYGLLGKSHAHPDKRRIQRHKEKFDAMANTVRDQLTNSEGLEVYRTAYRMVDAMQDAAPGTQVAAAAVLFLAICDTLKVCMKDTLESVDRMTLDEYVNGAWTPTNIRSALRDYITNELGRHL